MKRFGMTLLVAASLATHVFAAGNQPTTTKWNGFIRSERLSKFLALNSNQSEEVARICDYFNSQMLRANQASAKRQEELIHNAVYGNLKLMKETLDEKQYAEYLRLMNVTLKNKGIEVK